MTQDPIAAHFPDRPRHEQADRPMWKQGMFWLAILFVSVAVLAMLWSNHKANDASKKATDALEQQAVIAKQQAAVAKLAADAAKGQAAEARDRLQQLRDVICGVYVPIGKAHLTGANSALGVTIVSATRKAAIELGCPGIK